MAKPIDFQLLRRYADDAKQCDAERDRQYRMYTEFAHQIEGLFSGDSIDSSPSIGRYNIIGQQINQICNPVLDQPPEVTVYPGDGATKSAATALGGTIRHIQYECSAAQAYSAALRQCAAGGLGAWLCVLDDDDATGGLQPSLEWVNDPTSVHWDPTHKRPDRRDARYVTRDYTMAREDFEEKYPGASIPNAPDGSAPTPETSESVQLTEIYLRVRRDGVKAINRYVITDLELLEADDTYPIPFLPVIMLTAPVCDINGKYTLMPLTYELMDVQKELAYWKTQTAKLIGRAPKSMFFADKGTIHSDDQKDYANAAIDELAVAILEWDSHNGTRAKPELIGAPEIPASYLQLIQHNMAFARDVTGIYPDQGQMQQQGRDPASGVAIKQQRSVSAMAAAWYTNQLNYGLRLTGDWLVSVAQLILNDDTVRVSMQGDNSTQLVSYGPTEIPGVANYDLQAGKFGVVIGAAPNYASQKQELLQTLGEMASKNEKVFELVADYIVAQWPLPGTEDLQERLQVGLLPPQVQKLIASKANSDPAARAQQMQMQLTQVTATKEQLQQALQQVSQQLTQLSKEYEQLKGDKQTEANLKVQLESMKLDVERLRIESTERIAALRVNAVSDDVDARNTTQRDIADQANATKLEIAGISAETKVGTTAMQHNHEYVMRDSDDDKDDDSASDVDAEEYHLQD